MIIDIHTHISNKLMWQKYQLNCRHKVSKIICIPWCNKNSQDEPRIPDVEELLKFTDEEKNAFALGSIDMEGNIQKQLERHKTLFEQKKIVGIKLYPGYQHFYPFEKKVVEIANLCEKYNKPLVFHIGDFFDPENKAVLKYAHPFHIDDLAKICPKTKIVISHFGFPYYMETSNVVAVNDNVYVDISAIMVKFDTAKDTINLQKQFLEDLKRVLTYFPIIKDKILFGTDYSGEKTVLCLINPYMNAIIKNLSKKQQENAFYKLAEKIYFS